MTTGISMSHLSALIGTVYNQITEPTAWAVKVLPIDRANRFSFIKEVATTGISQNRQYNAAPLPVGWTRNNAIQIKGMLALSHREEVAQYKDAKRPGI